TLVVDKTGTLTEGRPRLTSIVPVDSFTEEQLLAAAAAVERNSEHPLAAAIVNGANARKVQLSAVRDFQSTTGGGVMGTVDGQRVLVGKAAFLQSEGTSDVESLTARARELQQQGQTAIFV